jgi:hypothetical protein
MLAAQGLMKLAHFEPIWYFEIMMILNFMIFANEFFGYLIRLWRFSASSFDNDH